MHIYIHANKPSAVNACGEGGKNLDDSDLCDETECESDLSLLVRSITKKNIKNTEATGSLCSSIAIFARKYFFGACPTT